MRQPAMTQDRAETAKKMKPMPTMVPPMFRAIGTAPAMPGNLPPVRQIGVV